MLHSRFALGRWASVALMALLCAGFTACASAQTPSYTVSTFTVTGGGAYTLGYNFTSTQDITVTSLGQWILASDPTIANTETMGIYDSMGTLLFSTDYTQANATIVGNTDTDGNQFRYTDITSQFSATQRTLLANTEYTLAGTDYNSIVVADGNDLTADPLITLTSGGLFATGAFQQPTTPNIYNIYGMNFQFVTAGPTAATPEPGSIAMLIGMGMTGAGFFARRNRRK